MISPRSSPRFIRRSTTPTTGISPTPPPLPPRKSSPTIEQCTINITPQSSSNNSSCINLQVRQNRPESLLNEAQSVNDLSLRLVQNSELLVLPQISKSNSMNEISTTDNNQHTHNKQPVLELSTPETIYGIIDSRYNFCNIDSKPKYQNIVSNSSKTQSQSESQSELYISKELNPQYENIRFENLNLPPKTNKTNPLTSKTNGSVSYENLNMDYIKKLVNEGYSKDSVIRALGITRNNIDMACDILHEFGTKHG